MRKANSLKKTLMLGNIEGRRRRAWQRVRWLDGIANSVDMSLSKPQEIVKDRRAQDAMVHGVTKSRTRLSNWITTTTTKKNSDIFPAPFWELGEQAKENISLFQDFLDIGAELKPQTQKSLFPFLLPTSTGLQSLSCTCFAPISA